MPDENNNKAFFIESTDTVSAYNRLPEGERVTFGIKLGFSEEMNETQLDDLKDRLGLRISIYRKYDGTPYTLDGLDFVSPINRNGDEFFFETQIDRPLATGTTAKGSKQQSDEFSNFVLVQYIVQEEAQEASSGAARRGRRSRSATPSEEVVHSEIYYIGPQTPTEAIQAEQRNLIQAVKDVGNNIGDGQIDVNLLSTTSPKSPLLVLFKEILDSTRNISFDNYQAQIDRLFCAGARDNNDPLLSLRNDRALPFNDTDSYRILKIATEAFLMANLGCCNLNNIGSDDALERHFNERNIQFSANDSNSFRVLWQDYINPDAISPGDPEDLQVIPYLYIIRRKFKELGLKKNWVDQVIDQELCENVGFERNRLDEAEDTCIGIVQQRLRCPLYLELIWSYWQEEGMLVQTLNAISQRFQNIRGPGKNDPLAEMEIAHLMPLNNIMWGYIQDEQHRLSLQRRAYEYDHHYGITLEGKAAPKLRSADSRSRFIEAFHYLLHLVAHYYKDVTNKLVEPDPYPILNALREVHFIISEGMHNQYGGLPTTARIEMLMQQWILARPEFRQFLPGRAAVPYTEPWMDRVASMNKLQGWSNVSPMHFNYLASYGEQLLLSIRFADWSDEDRQPSEASLWAKYWRLQIQGYIHSYKVVTGVDLGATTQSLRGKVDSRPPSYHLARRLKRQQQNGRITATSTSTSNGTPGNGKSRRSSATKKEFLG